MAYALDEDVGEALLIDQRVDGQGEEQVGVDFDDGDGLALIIHEGLQLGENELPHLGQVDGLEGEEVFPHPPDDLHLAVVPPVQELEDLHLALQVVVDDGQRDLPLADLAPWRDDALVDELAGVDFGRELGVFVCEWVGRDQCLEGSGTDIVDECDSLISQVDYQHIVEDVEAGQAVARQLDDDLLFFGLDHGSELQLALIGVVKEEIGCPVNPLDVDEVILRHVLPLHEYLFVYAASFQPKTLLRLYSFGHDLIIGEIDVYLSAPEPVLGLLRVEVKDVGKVALPILEAYEKFAQWLIEETVILTR